MAKAISKGECRFCQTQYSKAGMSRHLVSCPSRPKEAKTRGSGKAAEVFHLVIEDAFSPYYWLHVEAPGNSTLRKLDDFLRDIWLECCGHLSQFRIGDVEYAIDADIDYGIDYGLPGQPPSSMKIKLSKVLKPGLRFTHEYDFGTTSELNLNVMGSYPGKAGNSKFRVMARNNPPAWVCDSCGRPATLVCGQCLYDGKGWSCKKCAKGHECGEDMLLPLVNSPRAGMCGYTGPSIE